MMKPNKVPAKKLKDKEIIKEKQINEFVITDLTNNDNFQNTVSQSSLLSIPKANNMLLRNR